MSIDDAVATALEQNLDLQVQRITPQMRDLDTSVFRANYTPNFTSTVNLVDQTQPPSSLLSGNTSQLTNGRSTVDFGVSSLAPWYGAVVPGRLEQRPDHHQQHLHQLRSPAHLVVQRQLHAAAAAQLQDRRHAPAAADQPEEPGDLGRPAAAVDCDHGAQRAQRLLRPDVCHRQPQRATAVARSGAAVAQRQPRPRRDRHHGAARHRAGGSGSRDPRRVGDPRRGGHRPRARHACGRSSTTRRRRTSGARASSRPNRSPSSRPWSTSTPR